MMKKVLSLILALAMVLSCVPFVFAEGEAESSEPVALQMVYGFEEAFKVADSHVFTTDMAASYPLAGLPSATNNEGTWSVGYYASNGGAYDTFTKFPKLYRYLPQGRAPEDKVNTTVVHGKPAEGDADGKINAADDGKAYPSLMWSNNVENSLMSTTTLYYPLTGGAQSVYGDGGYARTGGNCNGGAIGYNFDSGIHKPTSSLGYQTNATNNHQQAVIFTAPRGGYIQPNISLMGNKANVHAWQLYKLDAEGVKTQIYPRTGDTTIELQPTFTGAVVCDEWRLGWLLMATSTETFDTEKFWINEGEKLVLRFGGTTTGAQHTGFEIAHLDYTYLAPTTATEAEYDGAVRLVDFRALQTFPEASDFAAAEGLTETDVDGVFTVDAGFVSGSTATITETLGTAVHTITAKLTQAQYHYDLGDVFAVSGDYTDETLGKWYYPTNLTPVYANGSNDVWEIGYSLWSDGYTWAKHKDYNELIRNGKDGRANEDPNTALSPSMAWDLANNGQSNGGKAEDTAGVGYYTSNVNGRYGVLGYQFGSGRTTTSTAATGWSSTSHDNHKIVRFTAPRDGIVKVHLKARNINDHAAAYRIEKLTGDTRTTILPLNGEKTITTVAGDKTGAAVPEMFQNGWAELNFGSWTDDTKLLRVVKGDVLELRFAAVTSNLSFAFDTYSIDYVQPVADLGVVYFDADERLVDFRDAILDCEELMLTDLDAVSIILPATLSETETKGVFAIAEDFVNESTVSVSVQNDWNFLTINAKLKEIPEVYSLDDAFGVTNTFTGDPAVDYPQYGNTLTTPASSGLTPKNPNDGNSVWTLGYYPYASSYNTLTRFTILSRHGASNRAYEDDKNNITYPSMVWGTHTYTAVNDGGYAINNPNGPIGSLGYNFRSGQTHGGMSSATGWDNNGGEHEAIIFTAPMDGVYSPYLKLASTNPAARIVVRLDKISTDGTRTAVYPKAEDAISITIRPDTLINDNMRSWLNGWKEIPEFATGWTEINGGFIPQTVNGKLVTSDNMIYLKKGEKLEMRFTSKGVQGSNTFILDNGYVTYHKSIGADDELFLESPLTAYEAEETVVLYPEETVIDLSRELPEKMANGIVPAGTVEYTLSGAEGVLEETALPGIFSLTGALNYGGEAVTVTAGYYSPNKSAANGDAPRFTVSTKVYVRAYSSTVDVFTNDDYAVDVSGFGLGEGFFLPYYENVTERAIYGAVDLGLTDTWKGATVAFSEDGYFEYLGNGRIRALAKYDYTTAGGQYITKKVNADFNPVGGPTAETANKTVLYNIRGEYTTGTPITMTVTAKDGGVKEYSLWAFPAEVQDSTLGYDSYQFDLTAPLANPVMKLEAYLANGTTHPMYPDSMNNKKAISVDALEPYIATIGNYAPTPYMGIFADGSSTWMLPAAKGTFDAYIAPVGSTYVDYDGVSWTFTAPKSGNISLSDFTAFIQTTQKANYCSPISNAFKSTVRLYESETATEYVELFNCDYKHETIAFSDFNTVTVGDSSVVTYDEETGDLTFNVEKGQVVRVIFHSNGTNHNGYATLAAGVLPNPIFTYVAADEIAMEGNTLKVFVADDSNLVADGVLTMLYDEAGNLVETVETAVIDASYAEVNYASDDAAVSYAKLFFWDSLNNIQPIIGDILVRK